MTPPYETAAQEIIRLQEEGFLKTPSPVSLEPPFPGESHFSKLDAALLMDFLGLDRKKRQALADENGRVDDYYEDFPAAEGRSGDLGAPLETQGDHPSFGDLPMEEVQVLSNFMLANRGKRSVKEDKEVSEKRMAEEEEDSSGLQSRDQGIVMCD